MRLKLPDDSILDRCRTVFDWKVQQSNPLEGWKPPHYKIGKFLQAWNCQPIGTEATPGEKAPRLFICRYDSTDVPLEYVIMRNDSFLFKRGPSTSMEHAAEKCYQYWHEMRTVEKCKEALQPKPGRTLVLFGTWVDDQVVIDEPAKYKGRTYPGDDTRENLTFVHGDGPDKIEAKVAKLLKPRANAPIEHEILLESGFIIKTSLDWRVKQPQQYIEGDVMCKQGEGGSGDGICQAIGSVESLDMRYVHGYGLLCGICMDHLLGTTEVISESMMD